MVNVDIYVTQINDERRPIKVRLLFWKISPIFCSKNCLSSLIFLRRIDWVVTGHNFFFKSHTIKHADNGFFSAAVAQLGENVQDEQRNKIYISDSTHYNNNQSCPWLVTAPQRFGNGTANICSSKRVKLLASLVFIIVWSVRALCVFFERNQLTPAQYSAVWSERRPVWIGQHIDFDGNGLRTDHSLMTLSTAAKPPNSSAAAVGHVDVLCPQRNSFRPKLVEWLFSNCHFWQRYRQWWLLSENSYCTPKS